MTVEGKLDVSVRLQAGDCVQDQLIAAVGLSDICRLCGQVVGGKVEASDISGALE